MNYLIMALATWRISAMLSYEDGPRDVFRKLRETMGIEHQDDIPYQIVVVNDTFLASLFSCLWCVSVWIGAIIYVGHILWPDIVYLLMPFALSAVAIVIEKVARG